LDRFQDYFAQTKPINPSFLKLIIQITRHLSNLNLTKKWNVIIPFSALLHYSNPADTDDPASAADSFISERYPMGLFRTVKTYWAGDTYMLY